MALTTDDEDIRDIRFWMNLGGNGDYYISLIEYEDDGKDRKMFKARLDYRLAMSGGNAPTEVKLALAALYRTMEKAGLNKHPKDEN